MNREREELFAHTDENITAHYFEELDERTARAIENDNEMAEAAMEAQKKLDEWRSQQATKLSENAQLFKDAFLNAWDDMVNTGKFSIDKLFTYLIAEFARRGIAKLFDSLFSSGGSGNSWIQTGISALGSLFGGGRASGGSVQSGKFYEVGEKGRELFAPGMNGAIIPNGEMGGVAIDARTTIDARGASMELAKVLPKLLEQNRRATIAEILEGLRRRKFAV